MKSHGMFQDRNAMGKRAVSQKMGEMFPHNLPNPENQLYSDGRVIDANMQSSQYREAGMSSAGVHQNYSTVTEAVDNPESHNKVDWGGLGVKGVSDQASAIKWRDANKGTEGYDKNNPVQKAINTSLSKTTSKSTTTPPEKSITEVKKAAKKNYPSGWATQAVRESQLLDSPSKKINYLSATGRSHHISGNTTNAMLVRNEITKIMENNKGQGLFIEDQGQRAWYNNK